MLSTNTMSRRTATTTNANANARTPFCKVCHDAGKPASVYNSHYVKDTTGKVVCPTLNAVECRYCYKKGHTVKYCNVLKKNETLKQQDQEQVKIVAKRTAQVPTNKFSALYNYDAEEPIVKQVEQVQEEVQEQVEQVEQVDESAFPSLCASIEKKQMQNGFSFAAAAATAPAPKKEPSPYVHVNMLSKSSVYSLNWADDDSEDDDW